MAFAMVSVKEPRSINAERKEQYKTALRKDATGWMRRRTQLVGSLYIRIIWFHTDILPGDVDNITKPIRDALQGIVYENDNFIVKSITERINYTEEAYRLIASAASQGDAYAMLEQFLLERRYRHILYIEVGVLNTAPVRQIAVGARDEE